MKQNLEVGMGNAELFKGEMASYRAASGPQEEHSTKRKREPNAATGIIEVKKLLLPEARVFSYD